VVSLNKISVVVVEAVKIFFANKLFCCFLQNGLHLLRLALQALAEALKLVQRYFQLFFPVDILAEKLSFCIVVYFAEFSYVTKIACGGFLFSA